MRDALRQRLASTALQQAQAHPPDLDHSVMQGAFLFRKRVRAVHWVVAFTAVLMAGILITVHPALNAAPTTLIIRPPELILSPGERERLVANPVYPDGSTNWRRATVQWDSKNQAVAVVSPDGTVTARSPGNAIIVATQRAVTASAGVEVVGPVGHEVDDEGASDDVTLKDINIRPRTLDIIVGEETSLLAQGLYSDNTIKDLSTQVAWRSANPDIVKVDRNGQVTAIAPGETTITATIGRLVASVPTFVGYGATASPTNDGTSPSPARSPVPRPSPGIP